MLVFRKIFRTYHVNDPLRLCLISVHVIISYKLTLSCIILKNDRKYCVSYVVPLLFILNFEHMQTSI